MSQEKVSLSTVSSPLQLLPMKMPVNCKKSTHQGNRVLINSLCLKSKLDDSYIAQGLYVKAFQINHLKFDAARDSMPPQADVLYL
jgi:hypothetical protein